MFVEHLPCVFLGFHGDPDGQSDRWLTGVVPGTERCWEGNKEVDTHVGGWMAGSRSSQLKGPGLWDPRPEWEGSLLGQTLCWGPGCPPLPGQWALTCVGFTVQCVTTGTRPDECVNDQNDSCDHYDVGDVIIPILLPFLRGGEGDLGARVMSECREDQVGPRPTDAPGHPRGPPELREDRGHTCTWSPDVSHGVWPGARLCCRARRMPSHLPVRADGGCPRQMLSQSAGTGFPEPGGWLRALAWLPPSL